MKKIIFPAVFVFLLSSCGGGGSTSEAGGAEIDDLASANQIIEFNNEAVDYMNTTSDHIRKAGKLTDDLSRMIESKVNRRPNTTTLFIGGGMASEVDNLIKLAPGEVSDQLKNNLREMDKHYQVAKEKTKTIGKYLKNQDYKDDDWQKAIELNQAIIDGVNNYYSAKELVSKELSILGDKAEEKILEGHPLKDAILAAKLDIRLSENLQTLMFADKLDRPAIKEAYDELEKSSQKHKEDFNDALNEQGEKKSYDAFHEDIENYLGNIRRILRYDRELKTADFNSIAVDFKSIIRGYNSFIN